MSKGGQPYKGRQSQACAGNSSVLPSWEGSANERWRLVGGGANQVDGCSAPVRVGGGRCGYTQSEKRSRRVKDGGAIRDKSGGRGKKNLEQVWNRWGGRDRIRVKH